MIKHIFKQIWTERRQNSWITIELIVVFFFLLIASDFMWLRVKTYYEPTGFDIENTYILALKQLEPIAPDYISPENNPQTPMDDLSDLISRIQTYPDIETYSLSYHALPYSMSGIWSSLKVDSTHTKTIRQWAVTPSYFDVFHIRTSNNEPFHIENPEHKQIILTEDMANVLFGSAQQAIGKNVYYSRSREEDTPFRVISVSTHYKHQEFRPYEGGFFEILTLPELEKWVNKNKVTNVNICVRVRPGSAKHFEQNFIADMGDRLKENNLYVSSIIPSEKLRNEVVDKRVQTEIVPMTYVMIFVLITVFLGVFGTFWLRIRQRRSEIGIRMAMGAGRGVIRHSMITESFCLIAIAILPALLVYINLLHANILDTWRLPFTFGRVAIVFVIALFVIVIIVASGTSYPARQASQLNPVDALRDE
ncbi:MAG: FtsX-like permease family protein [Tannerella sp.]|jgi:putative ABC transport system permease protein|nr:FtsX-like permease family protein [Tannerella sp.]